MPAIVALIRFESVAASTTRRPRRATSARRSGATALKPPVNTAIDAKFAKPHNANDKMAMVRGSSTCNPAAATLAESFKMATATHTPRIRLRMIFSKKVAG